LHSPKQKQGKLSFKITHNTFVNTTSSYIELFKRRKCSKRYEIELVNNYTLPYEEYEFRFIREMLE